MPRLKPAILPGIAIAVVATAGTAFAVTGGDDRHPAFVQSGADAGRPVVVRTVAPSAEPPTAEANDARRRVADALSGTGLRIPAGWEIVSVRQERHDQRDVTLIRHQPDGYRLGGPHASLVLDARGTILGFTRLHDGADGPLPDRRRAEEIALRFLRQVAPDDVDGLSVHWVDQHDETVTLTDGTTATISGMKVKMHHDDGLYSWVVVGRDGAVLTYERDIAWDSGQGRRGTQMWLHDSWIAAREGTGPQPAPPYALATS
ncbi:hypothetical protein ETD86_47945 [Nonomuraea turkmeniaca]|uniref:DUF3500 domain-containing protein n=1 Tax=Nonomuraea turkmeniaca TaxID=103838 RepID=A0A5S4EXZ5_9ACTN|nr:hypothetical protein [Nonomuraea turkmeniaca]TMR08396.1 hypothetical protein ETD86_47945 [Nonomuraea turkmeniaca]